MPQTIVATLGQVLELNDITDVAVTVLTEDTVRGDYYRDLVFFGTAAEGETTVPTALTVRIRASATEPLKITVPVSEF